MRDLEQAIRLEKPGDPVVARDHTHRGRLLDHEGRHEEALAAFEAALKVVPDYAEAHKLRLDLLGKLKRHSEIILSCDALLAQGKPSAELYQLRGLAKESLKDYPARSPTSPRRSFCGQDRRLCWLTVGSCTW